MGDNDFTAGDPWGLPIDNSEELEIDATPVEDEALEVEIESQDENGSGALESLAAEEDRELETVEASEPIPEESEATIGEESDHDEPMVEPEPFGSWPSPEVAETPQEDHEPDDEEGAEDEVEANDAEDEEFVFKAPARTPLSQMIAAAQSVVSSVQGDQPGETAETEEPDVDLDAEQAFDEPDVSEAEAEADGSPAETPPEPSEVVVFASEGMPTGDDDLPAEPPAWLIVDAGTEEPSPEPEAAVEEPSEVGADQRFTPEDIEASIVELASPEPTEVPYAEDHFEMPETDDAAGFAGVDLDSPPGVYSELHDLADQDEQAETLLQEAAAAFGRPEELAPSGELAEDTTADAEEIDSYAEALATEFETIDTSLETTDQPIQELAEDTTADAEEIDSYAEALATEFETIDTSLETTDQPIQELAEDTTADAEEIDSYAEALATEFETIDTSLETTDQPIQELAEDTTADAEEIDSYAEALATEFETIDTSLETTDQPIQELAEDTTADAEEIDSYAEALATEFETIDTSLETTDQPIQELAETGDAGGEAAAYLSEVELGQALAGLGDLPDAELPEEVTSVWDEPDEEVSPTMGAGDIAEPVAAIFSGEESLEGPTGDGDFDSVIEPAAWDEEQSEPDDSVEEEDLLEDDPATAVDETEAVAPESEAAAVAIDSPVAWGTRYREAHQGWIEDDEGRSTWRPIVTSGASVAGWDIDIYLGMVSGDVTLDPEGPGTIANEVATARERAGRRMLDEALARGAHAVVGVTFSVHEVAGTVLVAASGVAVTLRTPA